MVGTQKVNFNSQQQDRKTIKCVVWDLDNTLWQGVLLEDEQVVLRDKIKNIIITLDSRGILQSIASKNELTTAIAKLAEFELKEYFLYPQINWNSKASSLEKIATSLNIGINAIAFIDDQQFELEEVRFTHPEILCIDAASINQILDLPVMNPRFITEDSQIRRLMYLNDIERNHAEEQFIGTGDEFLATLKMNFTIAVAQESDLQRAEELTQRTNQLNTTGYTYSYDELNQFRQSEQHLLLVASLTDRYGSYGKIGLALIERQPEIWTIKLLLMSCRVMSRGVGTIMMNHIMSLAQSNQVRLQAEFVSNNRNRMMYISYKFAGFREAEQQGDLIILENDLSRIQDAPEYVNFQVIES
ncbi:MAG: HAD-IIIC family phosphatase [Cyanobacteria bacterium J06621_8]